MTMSDSANETQTNIMEISNLGGSLIPIFTFFYIFVYLLGYFTFFKNWDIKKKPQASSCLISLAHGTPSCILSIYANFLHPQTPKHLFNFATQNTPFQTLVFDYSIAYFLIDTSHYLLFTPHDHLFIIHHVAVLYVFITCRYVVGYGGPAILVLLVLAEVTSPLQNMWSLAKYRKDEVAVAARLYDGLSPYFYGVYTMVRGVVAPVLVYRMVVVSLSGGGDDAVEIWVWVSWMVVIVCGILASMLWVSCLWLNFFKERSKNRKLS